MKFKIEIELTKVKGVEQDRDTLVDYFCGSIGRQNGAQKPLRLKIPDSDGETASVYEVTSADDA